MNLNRAVVILDWIGWMLMLNTLWDWVYDQSRPLIEKSIARTERRMKALGKLVKHRYGRNFEKLDFMQRILTYNERLGFDPYMSWWMQTFILVKQRGIQKRLLKYGLVSDEDRQVWEQEKVDRRRGKGLSRRLGFEMMSLFLKRVTIGIFDRLRDILQGAPATVLFALGFVMWNVSKVISLWIL